MATEGDRDIARDRAVQRTSKERPPLHLQNLGFAEGRRKSGPAVHAWIQNVENARTGSLRARMTRPALVSRSTLKGDAAAMCGSTTDGARAMLQTRANTRPNWSHSHRTAS